MRALAAEIGEAARDIGFFAITNHGVSEALLERVFDLSRAFFGQSDAQKAPLSSKKATNYAGWARIGVERLDPARPGDAKESFNIALDQFGMWPSLDGFQTTMLEYFRVMADLMIALHRPIALDLGLDDPDFFTPLLEDPMSVLRLLRYPPHPGEFDGGLHGAAPHTDYGLLTLLAQDGTAGLEVRARNGTWVEVEPTPGTFVCNIADSLMRWTNDIYVSTPHRVVNRSGRERYSVAFFGDPNADALIECLPACASADRPPKYPPITYRAYQKILYEATYGRAKSA
jgi:isopenicillin N synthase-like dioxygenase